MFVIIDPDNLLKTAFNNIKLFNMSCFSNQKANEECFYLSHQIFIMNLPHAGTAAGVRDREVNKSDMAYDTSTSYFRSERW